MQPQNGTPAPPSEDSMSQALEDYLEAVEAGTAPPREEFLARYPELAKDLDGCLAALRFIGRAAEGQRSVVADIAEVLPPEQAAGLLGDFRILREVGRGGMGVVYEAEQVSLGRRVALKVLPFAATMDPRQLQRFHNEARAAASLDHPHIVHVHAVGCERAVHFYAMQFIEGQTLAALIADLRQRSGRPVAPEAQPTTPHIPESLAPASAPADTAPQAAVSTERAPLDRAYFRRVAELGIQAAEALDHAHQLGIVHRDVKPANLLVDGRGGLWVTDFGLAHIQSDARLTMTGDLVGTLRYMSPEQALAQRVVIDHRTDVYSLGATLYELLTLEPAFRGNDRQELLRQIAIEEPVRPRKVNRGIPADLETIVLKAMEKNPAERYATAKELADDLRRFLADQPTRARPAGVVRRLRKWGRRHRAAVTAAAVALTAAVVVLSGGIGWVVHDRATRAQRTTDVITTALNESAQWQLRRRVPEALSAARRAQAALAGGHADPAIRRQVEARVADLELLSRLEEARLGSPATKDIFLDRTLADQRFARIFREAQLNVDLRSAEEVGKHIARTSIAVELAALLDDWAMLRRSLKPKEEARWKHLLDVACAADPDGWRTQLRDALRRDDPAALLRLASSETAMQLIANDKLMSWTLAGVADRLRTTGAVPAVEALLRRAHRQHPDDFWINQDLGSLLSNAKPPRHDEAIPFYVAAVALRPQSAGAHYNLGNALYRKRDLQGAIAAYQKAIEINPRFADAHLNLGLTRVAKDDWDGAIAEFRVVLEIDPDYIPGHVNLGNALVDRKNPDGAMKAFQKAIAIDPDCVPAYIGLGICLEEKHDRDGAIKQYRKAIRINPNDSQAHNNLANALADKGDVDGAIAAYRKAIRLDRRNVKAHYNLGCVLHDKRDLDGAIKEYREAVRLDPDLAEAHNQLGLALHDKGRSDEAIVCYKEAIRLKKDFGKAHHNLGNALWGKGRQDEAIAEYREAIRFKEKDPRVYYNLGVVLHAKGQLDEAIAAWRQAVRLKNDYAEAHCNLGLALKAQGRPREALTALKRGHELGSRDPRWPHPSLRWIQQTERLVELEAKLPQLLNCQVKVADTAERLAMAQLCRTPAKKLYAATTRFYAEAFAAEPQLAGDLRVQHRYNAACAAALAACGQGKDADQVDAKERARLRQQALDWLRADLKAYALMLERAAGKAGPTVAQRLQHWLHDDDFAGVRGAEALARLSEAERQDWQKLWADVAATLAQAQKKGTAAEKEASPQPGPKPR
jgi:tetratricopeptide (TPR) repeat protein/serine/threonine protein kinase